MLQVAIRKFSPPRKANRLAHFGSPLRAIVNLLSTHQSRWRGVEIWFEMGPSSRLDPAGIPIPKTQPFVEDLTLLEELHLNFSTEYIITSASTSRTGRSLRKFLPSLICLELLAPRERRETMLDHMACVALKELHLQPGWASNDALVALYKFPRRIPGVPESFRLIPSDYLPDATPIFEVLTPMPSLRMLSIGWCDNWHLDMGDLLQALARTSDPSNPIAAFALLPALENLEIVT